MTVLLTRTLRFVASVLSVSGVLLLTDAALTLVWQEPVSALLAARSQAILEDQISREFADLWSDRQGQGQSTTRLDRGTARVTADLFEDRLTTGRGIGWISLPSLGRRYAIVQGTDAKSLRKGPAHYADTPLPGQGGTIAIAGHRTTYLAPFRTIDKLRPGHAIVVTMPYGRFTYRVRSTRIVGPQDVWVKRPVGYEQLMLSACHPLYSAARRIIVFARLASVQQPRRAGAA